MSQWRPKALDGAIRAALVQPGDLDCLWHSKRTCEFCGVKMIQYAFGASHPPSNTCTPLTQAEKRCFREAATLVTEGIEDHVRGEVTDLTQSRGDDLMHIEFTRQGRRYRVEMREIGKADR